MAATCPDLSPRLPSCSCVQFMRFRKKRSSPGVRLVTRAAKMSDHSWRESFLEGVPENAATIELARAWVDAHSGRATKP